MPRRVLTNPPKGVGNNGHDNADANLICCVNDELEAPGTRYVVLDLLGQGTFGQVFRCQDTNTRKVVAVKVVKNKPAYRAQADIEIRVARLLNDTFDPDNSRHIVRLLDSFAAHNHLCLVFELLSINIYELLKTNQFRGLPLPMIRSFTKQMLEALAALEAAHVIHCDLKPENVLMVSKLHRGGGSGCGGGGARPAAAIKLIDFGSACWEGNTMYSYIQSRFYRSPEVLLGLPYDGAIDMWSLGCMCLEMFLGLPIFPGVSDHNQISRIVEMVGLPPEFMLQNGRDTLKFFRRERVVTRPPGEGAWGAGMGLAAMDANGDSGSAPTVEHR
ncbi:kinase-like domain-containing protein [Tribonema minus]|uniref:Kinase-like domain-containing protein n=1 Tax=Tribonema minus TaxID=303371 RepID=A0A835ZGJ2_9STRA|nr:kinase-like domain-containing protein [Tribonema minus]